MINNPFTGITSRNINTIVFTAGRPTKKIDSQYLFEIFDPLDSAAKVDFINLLKEVSIGTREDVGGVITSHYVEGKLGKILRNYNITHDYNITLTPVEMKEVTSSIFNIAQIMRPGQARAKEKMLSYFTSNESITVSQTVKDLIMKLSDDIDIAADKPKVLSSNETRTNIREAPILNTLHVEREFKPTLEHIINTACENQNTKIQASLQRLLEPPIAGKAEPIDGNPFFTPEAVKLSQTLLSGINSSGVHFICDNNGKLADVIFTLLQNGYIQTFGEDLQQRLASCLAYEANSLALPGRNPKTSKEDSSKYLEDLQNILHAIEFTPAADRRHLRAIVNIGDFFDDDTIDDRLLKIIQGDDPTTLQKFKAEFTEQKTFFCMKLLFNGLINNDIEICAGKITLIFGNHDDTPAPLDNNVEEQRIKAVLKTMHPFSIDSRHNSDFFIAHTPISAVTSTSIHTGFGVIDIKGCKNRADVWQRMKTYYNDNKQIYVNKNNDFDLRFKAISQSSNTPTHSEMNKVIQKIANHHILGPSANNGKPLVIVHGHYHRHTDGLIQHDNRYKIQTQHDGVIDTDGIQSSKQCGVLNINSYHAQKGGDILGGCILQPDLEDQIRQRGFQHIIPPDSIPV